MCSVERWVVSLDDAETFDFGGAFIPAYEGRLESEGWKAVDMGSAVGRHGGVYWKGRDPWERRHLFVDASGIVAHMRCRAARSGLTATERRRLFDEPAPYGPALPKTRPSHPADGRKTRRTGPEAIQAVVDFADVDNDRLDALADEELMDPVERRHVRIDARRSGMLSDRFMLFSGPYDPKERERIVVLVAQRLMFARIAADVLDRLSDLSGIPGRADEAMGLEVNLRLSYASLVCHPHWRPELESVLDDMYATERDYRLGCEAADAIEAACGAGSVKWKRALAVGLDALTVAVAVATIRQMLTDGDVLSAIPLSALLIAVTTAAAWFSWRARRG